VLAGAHCSGGVKSSLDRAAEFGAEAVQLFAQSPRAWRFPEHERADLERFRARREELGIRGALIHALYLVNLASPDDEIYVKSVETMRKTVDTGCAIGADAVIFHVGSHLGAGFEAGLDRAVPAIAAVLERCSDTTWLLLENSAGAGATIGRSIDELATIIDRLDSHPRLGICLDSCHLFVSGVDVTDRSQLDRVLAEVDDAIGLDRLRAVHVNDAAAPLGSNRDRHANILEGLMGEKLGVFCSHPAFRGLPSALEVPGKNGRGPDADEVAKLKALISAPEKRPRSPRGRSSAAR
jgi:deoxyribonuclease-4